MCKNLDGSVTRINRYIVECKSIKGAGANTAFTGINRYIVECK